MEKLVSVTTSKQLDIDSQKRYKIDPLILMEQAGTRAYNALIDFLDKKVFDKNRIVFVVGGGNNGGDALVMARLAYLDNCKDFSIVMVNSPSSSLCLEQFNICTNLKFPIIDYFEQKNRAEQIIKEANVIVDGITGLGLKGPIRKDLADLIIFINRYKAKESFVVSIDVPSGLSEEITVDETYIRADLTITMGLKKVFAYHDKFREAWGEIVCVNPSFALELLEEVEKEAQLIDENDLKLNRISENAYKNVRGHLALFAGSKAYSGAARLTSKAAFTSGLGLVTLFCDKEIYSAVGYESPSVIIRTLEEFETTNFNQKYQAIVAGPGWGKNREKILLNLLNCKLPIILDADALIAYVQLITEGSIDPQKVKNLVLTPHPGEFNQIVNLLNLPNEKQSPKNFITLLKKVAQITNSVLVYKSSVTWICNSNQLFVIDGQNNSLGVAGSGDTLAGIIGSLLAQNYTSLDAALKAVQIHQKAGRLAKENRGWYDSSTLIDYIGVVCRYEAKLN
jgi:hydroxyethylthiazole kinase-like uncharacterized protein yjeF